MEQKEIKSGELDTAKFIAEKVEEISDFVRGEVGRGLEKLLDIELAVFNRGKNKEGKQNCGQSKKD